MKTKTSQAAAPSTTKPRPRRAAKKMHRLEEWQSFGADFLRAVTSGSRMSDDRSVLAGMHGFLMDPS